jgi:formate hydrogenlyase transcriptional activator
MPSLRERGEDILLLVEHFINRYAKATGKTLRRIEKRTLKWLQAHDWPGNIRELQNIVERAVILCDGEVFSIDPAWLQTGARRLPRPPVAFAITKGDREKEIIEAALEESRGRIAGPFGAAEKLGMPRTTLESKIKSLRINKDKFKVSGGVVRHDDSLQRVSALTAETAC